jgi:pimeloyl-ACP methyl ester carboxylesterase
MFPGKQTTTIQKDIKQGNKVRKIFLILGLVLLGIVLLLIIVRFIAQRVIYHNATKSNKISELVTMKLGGYDQKVMIEGKTAALPILICLHGGPELPVFFGNAYRGAYPELTEQFILVQWDQYGCGLNYARRLEELGIADFKNMVCDLVHNLKERFPGQDIFLFGTSWGSVLTMEAAAELKNDISGIINASPFQSLRAAKEVQYEVLKNTGLSDQEMDLLEKCSKSDDIDSYLPIEAMAYSKGCLTYLGKGADNSYLSSRILRVLISPDYSPIDILHAFYMENPAKQKRIRKLLVELYEADEAENMVKAEVPLLILRGDQDVFGYKRFFEDLPGLNSNITYVELPNCGHFPSKAAFHQIQKEMIRFMTDNR